MHPIGTYGNNDWEVRLSQLAVLALEDGTIFRGLSIGASGTTVGEVVFNTAMTGYQEILTDPSYCRQIVTLTYPHIGNTGVTREDEESTGIQAAGLIIRDLPLLASNFRSEQSLSDYLIDADTVAIADIDTRKLTRILRDGGAQSVRVSLANASSSALPPTPLIFGATDWRPVGMSGVVAGRRQRRAG